MIYENSVLLDYYTACSGHSLTTFRDKTLEDGTDWLSQKFRQGITTRRCVIAQRSAVLIYFAAEARNHALLSSSLSIEPFEFVVGTSVMSAHIALN